MSTVWLLDLHIGQQTLRYATEIVNSHDLGGFQYESGLIVEGAAPTPSLASAVSVSFPMALVPHTDTLHRILESGFDLSLARADVYLWDTEDSFDRRRRYLWRGRLSNPTFGSRAEPILFSVDTPTIESTLKVPNPRLFVTGGGGIPGARTWDAAFLPSSSEGKQYPLVFGSPGSGGTDPIPGSPGIIVDFDQRWLLIAGHEVAATSVHVQNMTRGNGWALRSVIQVTDQRGNRVSVCPLPLGNGPGEYDSLQTLNDAYWVSWPRPGEFFANPGGGLWNEGRTGALTEAEDVLIYLLQAGGIEADFGSLKTLRSLGIRLAGYVDESVSAWDYIRRVLLPILPLSEPVYGPDGLTFVRLPRSLDLNVPIEGLRTLEVGRTCARVSPYEVDNSEVTNDFEIRYALDGFGNTHVRGVDVDRVSSPLCALSDSRYGTRQAQITTDVVYDPASALSVLGYQAAIYALPWRMVSVEVTDPVIIARWVSEGAFGPLGHMVRYIDHDPLFDVVGVIESYEHTPGTDRMIVRVAFK
jgi:hypothetical protein